MEAVTVRPIEISDIDAFHALLDSVSRERQYLAMTEAPAIGEVRDFVRSNLARGDPQMVAELDGQLVGWADLLIRHRNTMQHMGNLGMGVANEYRGKGIGRQLLQAIIDHAWEMGLKRIQLEVFVNNDRAIALYESMGFQPEGRAACARIIDGRYLDIYRMGLLHPDLTGLGGG